MVTSGEEEHLHREGVLSSKGVRDRLGQVPAISSGQQGGREGRKPLVLFKVQAQTLDSSIGHFIFFLENTENQLLRSDKGQRDE